MYAVFWLISHFPSRHAPSDNALEEEAVLVRVLEVGQGETGETEPVRVSNPVDTAPCVGEGGGNAQLIDGGAELGLVARPEHVEAIDAGLRAAISITAILYPGLVERRRRLPPPKVSYRRGGIGNVLEGVAVTR